MLRLAAVLLALAAAPGQPALAKPAALDPCLASPCLHGGACARVASGFTCACVGGYSGKTCEARCGRSQLIAYKLEGRFKLTGTALGATDGDWPLPGTSVRPGGTPAVTTSGPNLVLRVFEGGRRVSLVSFALPQNVAQATVGTEAFTNVLHQVPYNPCGAATGTLSGTTLTWDACALPSGWGTRGWGVDELASGPGCLSGFGDVGNIWCSGWACALGGLRLGDNPVTRPPIWSQPLAAFRFSSPELTSFTADYFDVPNARKNARSQIAITAATELSRTSELTPECACAAITGP